MAWNAMESDCLSHFGLVLPCKVEKRSRRTSSWKTFSWIIVGKIHFCMWRPVAAAHFDCLMFRVFKGVFLVEEELSQNITPGFFLQDHTLWEPLCGKGSTVNDLVCA